MKQLQAPALQPMSSFLVDNIECMQARAMGNTHM
jgi:hypothetical protein